MPTTQTSSPLASALNSVLSGHATPDGQSQSVVVVSYRDTFDQLWCETLTSGKLKVANRELSLKDDAVKLLIVGSESPERELPESIRNINFASHLSALSWAGAWRSRFPKSRATVMIISHGSNALSEPAARLAKLFQATTPECGRIVEGVGYLPPRLVSILAFPAASGRTADSSLGTGLVRDSIRTSLGAGDPESRHSLSNILGSYVLRAHFERGQDEPAADSCPPADALVALLRSLNPSESKEDRGSAPDAAWVPISEHNGVVEQFFLIDDMAAAWVPFMMAALGLSAPEERARLRTLETPDQLGTGGSLLDFLRRKDDGAPQVNICPGTALSARAILFLDLRLFSGREKHEFPFLRQLLTIAKQEVEGSGVYLPWRPFAAAELEEMETAIVNESRDSEGYQLALTLLPRLLAQWDPVLPIVIFSSTHQRIVLEALKDYGNLITDFQKPMFFTGANTEEFIEDCRRRFRTAMEKAIRIVKTRSAVRALRTAGTKRQGESSHRVVEIFVDESMPTDRSYLSVGAIVALAESHEKVNQFCCRLESAGLQWGLSSTNIGKWIEEIRRPWADTATRRLECRRGWRIRDTPAEGEFLRKRASDIEMRDAAAKICEVAAECDVQLFAAALSANVADAKLLVKRPATGFSTTELDELHRELVRHLIQMLVVAHPDVSAALRHEDSSLSLDLGDRTMEGESGRTRCEQIFQTYGLRYTDQSLSGQLSNEEIDTLIDFYPECRNYLPWVPNANVISIASDHAMFALREALAPLPSRFMGSTERCRAVGLIDFENNSRWLYRLYQLPAYPRQVHYFADWIARQSARAAVRGEYETRCLGSLFESGYSQELTSRTQSLLNAIITGLNGRKAEAIKSVSAWLEDAPPIGRAEQMLLDLASDWPGRLGGHELRELFALESETL